MAGFYGLGGVSKKGNFGLASNMTLPIIKKVEKEKGDHTAYSATMPHEKKSVKKKARFAVEQLEEEEEQPVQEVVLRNPSKKPSWRSRVSSLFRRNSKLDTVADARAAAVPDPENDPPKTTVDDLEVETRKAAKKKRRKKRDAKSHSTAFEETTNIPYLLSEEMHNSKTKFYRTLYRLSVGSPSPFLCLAN